MQEQTPVRDPVQERTPVLDPPVQERTLVREPPTHEEEWGDWGDGDAEAEDEGLAGMRGLVGMRGAPLPARRSTNVV